jgi:iron(III) transport system substrate-binding protein
LEPGGDEVDEAYASLGMDPAIEPGYGLTGWDSYETTLDGELAMAPCMTLEPVIGIKKNSYIAIANGAPHPNAAKLFIKFLLTEEGMDPWMKIGIYPGIAEIPLSEGMPAMEEVKLWLSDDGYAWANNSKVRDFFAAELLGQ